MSYGKIKEYKCCFCKHEFKAKARAAGGYANQRGIKLKCVSNQVRCPECGNFLKVWDNKDEREAEIQ